MQSSIYRVIWRWHFFAGLLVLPFLVLLSITGGLYLFHEELDAALYHSWRQVQPVAAPLPMSVLAERTEAALGGRVTQVTVSGDAAEAVQMLVRKGAERLSAFVDPADGRVLGVTEFGGTMEFIRNLHSLEQFGFYANCLIEVAAGWSIVLVGTGLYLWLPRGRRQGVVSVRGRPKQRVFWRDLHAVTGLFAGAAIVFLALTGMPWSAVWGAAFQSWATGAGLGNPAAPVSVAGAPPADAGHAGHAGHDAVLPWAMERLPLPISSGESGREAIGLDRALAVLQQAGLPVPFTLALPAGPSGVYTATCKPHRVQDLRVVHLDQYSGTILGDSGFAALGPAGKATSWAIAVHQGEQYGRINRYLMLAGCVAILLLAVSGATMWWKRRPRGSLGVPPTPADPSVVRGLLAILVPAGIVFPLLGGSLLVAMLADLSLARIRRRSAA